MKLITLLAIIIIPSIFYGQDATLTKSYREGLHLKGKVSYMEEIKYKADETSGRLQKGAVLMKNTYRFDLKGNLLEEESYDTQFRYKRIYTYDSLGKRLTLQEYNQKDLESTLIYNYILNGKNVIEENSAYQDGSYFLKIKRNFDLKGNMTEQLFYASRGIVTTKYTYSYDDKGNQIEEHMSSSYVEAKWISKYDEKGNRIELSRYTSGKLENKQTFAYDEQRNKIEENSFNSDESLRLKITYKYDEQGNQTEINEINPAGILKWKTILVYLLDKKSNWVKSVYFVNNNPTYIYERSLEYFQ